jgi:hypothetical protein
MAACALRGDVIFFSLWPKRKRVWLATAVMLFFALTPISLWKWRNQQVSQFSGLSDIAGQCAWQFLVPRVMAQVSGQDKWVLKERAVVEENSWKLPIDRADQERWRRATAIFVEHPWLTGYYFLLSGVEHAFHPSPSVLSPAELNFSGDYWTLAVLWASLIILRALAGVIGRTQHRAERNIQLLAGRAFADLHSADVQLRSLFRGGFEIPGAVGVDNPASCRRGDPRVGISSTGGGQISTTTGEVKLISRRSGRRPLGLPQHGSATRPSIHGVA